MDSCAEYAVKNTNACTHHSLSSFPRVAIFEPALVRGTLYHMLYQHPSCSNEAIDKVLQDFYLMLREQTTGQTLAFLNRILPTLLNLPDMLVHATLSWWKTWHANTRQEEWWSTCASLMQIDSRDVVNWEPAAMQILVQIVPTWQRCAAARLFARLAKEERVLPHLHTITQLLLLCTSRTKLFKRLLSHSPRDLARFLDTLACFPNHPSRDMVLWRAQSLVMDIKDAEGCSEMLTFWNTYPTFTLSRSARDRLYQKAKQHRFSPLTVLCQLLLHAV